MKDDKEKSNKPVLPESVPESTANSAVNSVPESTVNSAANSGPERVAKSVPEYNMRSMIGNNFKIRDDKLMFMRGDERILIAIIDDDGTKYFSDNGSTYDFVNERYDGESYEVQSRIESIMQYHGIHSIRHDDWTELIKKIDDPADGMDCLLSLYDCMAQMRDMFLFFNEFIAEEDENEFIAEEENEEEEEMEEADEFDLDAYMDMAFSELCDLAEHKKSELENCAYMDMDFSELYDGKEFKLKGNGGDDEKDGAEDGAEGLSNRNGEDKVPDFRFDKPDRWMLIKPKYYKDFAILSSENIPCPYAFATKREAGGFEVVTMFDYGESSETFIAELEEELCRLAQNSADVAKINDYIKENAEGYPVSATTEMRPLIHEYRELFGKKMFMNLMAINTNIGKSYSLQLFVRIKTNMLCFGTSMAEVDESRPLESAMENYVHVRELLNTVIASLEG